MPYQNWSVEHELLSSGDWISLRELRDIHRYLSTVDISLQAKRTDAFNLLASLPYTDVFSEDHRFRLGIWINLAEPSWLSIFTRLRSALSGMRDRSGEVSIRQRTVSSSSDLGTRSQEANDASQQYWNTVRDLGLNLRSLTHSHTRESIENNFDLEWNDP
jgi:hypothetical protein